MAVICHSFETSVENIEVSNDNNDMSYENIEYDEVEYSNDNVNYSNDNVEYSNDTMEYSNENVEYLNDNVEYSNDNIEHSNENIEVRRVCILLQFSFVIYTKIKTPLFEPVRVWICHWIVLCDVNGPFERKLKHKSRLGFAGIKLRYLHQD